MMTIEFGREDAGRWRWRGDRGRTDDLERTSASCSGARSEASAIWFARRDARRRSWGVDPDPAWRWGACGARALERFDDDHPAATTWASAGRRTVFALAVGLGVRVLGRDLGRGERLADALDVAGSDRAGEQAVMADAVEAAGQHVQEKTADELGGVERHCPEPVAAFDGSPST